MNETITIEQEVENRNRWLKVFVPQKEIKDVNLSIQNSAGALLKRMSLRAGYNAIDISHVIDNPISIKVETPHQTILKQINIGFV
jgi:hypothetical protein